MFLAQKASDRHLFFLKFRKHINSIQKVWINFPIAITVATNGTNGTDISKKIDLV